MAKRIRNKHNLATAPTVTKSIAKVILVEMFEGGEIPDSFGKFMPFPTSGTIDEQLEYHHLQDAIIDCFRRKATESDLFVEAANEVLAEYRAAGAKAVHS